jgi:hypothetical protein
MTVTAGGGAPLIQGAGFADGDIFTIAIDPDTQTEEICYVVANSGDVFTIQRARAGTSQVAHASGATVRHVLTSADLDFFRNGVDTADGAIPKSTVTTKGDLIAATASATVSRVGIGSNGTVLTADSTDPAGVAWAAAPTGIPSQTGNGGKYLKTDGSTASWNNVDITISTATGTAYTAAITDVNKLVQLNNAAAVTVTVPASVFTTGQQVNIQQIGAGPVTVQGDGTSVLTSTGASGPAPVTRAQYSAATIVCTSSNNFTVIGDLA